MSELDIEHGLVTLAMGGGGKETDALISSIFRKHLSNSDMTSDDAAVLPKIEGRLAVTTDGFIVSPCFFPGGNAGKLSVCGTVNDLVCMGSRPLYLTCSVVIEEGFPLIDLDRISESMAETAKEASVHFVAGDTKVCGKGQVDGVFITTTGVGVIEGSEKEIPSGERAKAGDVIIVTGDVGRHGAAILTARGNLGIEAKSLTSDCAPLAEDMLKMLFASPNTHTLRDATRGGVGTVLYEIARQSNIGIEIDREAIPLSPPVKGVCSMLGLEPLYLACEGRMVVFVPEKDAASALNALKKGKYTAGAAIIGRAVNERAGRVVVNTSIGSRTMLPEPGGELLPRIC